MSSDPISDTSVSGDMAAPTDLGRDNECADGPVSFGRRA